MSLQSQTVTNMVLNLPQEQTNDVFVQQMLDAENLKLLCSNKTISDLDSTLVPVPVPAQTIPDRTGLKISPQEAADLKAQGWTDKEIAGAIPVKAITNREGRVIPPEDIPFLKAQGYTDEEIQNLQPIGTVNGQPQTKQATLSPTPPDLKNAIIYVDSFLGSGKTGFPADVMSIKKGTLKFRIGGKDFDYSGNFSILLTTPRQHKNPYFGLGKPETVKLLILEDFFKGEADGTMPLPNATIWEKSEGYIVATGADKEWIHSGTYTIQN